MKGFLVTVITLQVAASSVFALAIEQRVRAALSVLIEIYNNYRIRSIISSATRA
jgi:hypothetical protein